MRVLPLLVLINILFHLSVVQCYRPIGDIVNPKGALRKPIKDFTVQQPNKTNKSFSKEDGYYEEEEYNCCTGEPITWEDGNKFIVTVGVYIDQITSVDVQASTFFATGYLWFKWNSCYTTPDGEYWRPDETTVVENVAQQWATTLTPVHDAPECDTPEPGIAYRDFGFNFNLGMKFSYTRYPIDKQELLISFEDLVYDDRYVVLKYDKDSNYSPKVSLPKFNVGDKITRVVDSDQDTTYGLGGVKPVYSRAEIGLVIERKVSYFIVKILPPIFITLITAIVAFCIDPLRVFERLYVIPGSVLSLVFLQIGFSAETPDGGSMTVTDWVFNWCYFLVLIMLLENALLVLIMTNWEIRVAKITDWGDTEYFQKTTRVLAICRRLSLLIDILTLTAVIIGATVGTTIVILIARYA